MGHFQPACFHILFRRNWLKTSFMSFAKRFRKGNNNYNNDQICRAKGILFNTI